MDGLFSGPIEKLGMSDPDFVRNSTKRINILPKAKIFENGGQSILKQVRTQSPNQPAVGNVQGVTRDRDLVEESKQARSSICSPGTLRRYERLRARILTKVKKRTRNRSHPVWLHQSKRGRWRRGKSSRSDGSTGTLSRISNRMESTSIWMCSRGKRFPEPLAWEKSDL